MNDLRRLTLAAAIVAPVAVLAVPAAMSFAGAQPKPPAVKVKNRSFGDILQSKNKLPLYYWSVEKRAGGRIRCTDECARVWPPLIVKSRAAVPTTMRGVKGKFGVMRRADVDCRSPSDACLLRVHHDPPNTVLSDNVDGWFVVRV